MRLRVGGQPPTLALNLEMIFDNVNISGRSITTGVIVTITGKNQSIVYDGQSHSLSGYNFSCNVPGYTVNDIAFSGSSTVSRTNVGTTNMGLDASQFSNINRRFDDVTFIVTDGYIKVTSKSVTVTADAKSKTYDNNSGTDPALTATVSGTIGADTVTYTISRTSGQNAGTYTITPTGTATQGNYTVSFVAGTFTINRKAVTVKADNKSKTYGGTDPTLTATVSGTIGTDTVTYTLSRASGSNAGTYTITPTGNATQGNYSVTYQTGTFTINPASVTLTANSGTKTYNGSNQSVTGFTASVSGLTFSGVSASGTGKNQGTYSVTFTGVTVNTTTDSTGNYKVTGTTNGTLTINRKAVTVKEDNKSKTYGASDPTLTATVTGLIGSDTVSYTISRASGNNAGTYTITPTGNATQGNYTVTYQTGTFTINKAAASALGLKVTAYTGVYDGESHSVTVSVTVSSGTTLQYRASTSDSWSNSKPSYTTGTHTTYVRAVNSNYETASSSAKVTIDSSKGAILFVASSAANVSVFRYSDNYEIWSGNINAGNTVLTSVPADTYWAQNNTAGLIISLRFTVTAGNRVTLNVN